MYSYLFYCYFRNWALHHRNWLREYWRLLRSMLGRFHPCKGWVVVGFGLRPFDKPLLCKRLQKPWQVFLAWLFCSWWWVYFIFTQNSSRQRWVKDNRAIFCKNLQEQWSVPLRVGLARLSYVMDPVTHDLMWPETCVYLLLSAKGELPSSSFSC